MAMFRWFPGDRTSAGHCSRPPLHRPRGRPKVFDEKWGDHWERVLIYGEFQKSMRNLWLVYGSSIVNLWLIYG